MIYATIVKYHISDSIIFHVFEMNPADDFSNKFDVIKDAFNQVCNNFHVSNLRFHPVNFLQLQVVKEQLGQSIITSDELFASVQYQPVMTGKAEGTCRVFSGKVSQVELSKLTVRDIAVFLTDLPNDIPPVAALISFGYVISPLFTFHCFVKTEELLVHTLIAYIMLATWKISLITCMLVFLLLNPII